MRILAASLGLLLVSGCLGGGTDNDSPVPFDGEAAYTFTAGIVRSDDGSPRFRVPGTSGHAAGREWLWSQMQIAGWTAERQEFTGADYTPLDKGESNVYATSPIYCSDDEEARLSTLVFENFYAVHDEPGTDRLMLLGAHWESKRFASNDPNAEDRDEPVLGANDGAAGVGILLEIMRHVSEHDVDLAFDLGVAFFDGEDGFEDCHPLAGSIYFVSRLKPGEVDRMLLLDMVGDSNARFIRETHSDSCDPVAMDLLHELAADHGLAENFPGTRRSVQDDHLPFLAAGIPAADLIDMGRPGTQFPPYWHTTGDTLDKLSADMMGRAGDLVLDVLSSDRFADEWPAGC